MQVAEMAEVRELLTQQAPPSLSFWVELVWLARAASFGVSKPRAGYSGRLA